jgi:hypothetical protein
MELLGNVGHVEGRFNSHGDGVNLSEVDAQFAPNIPWAWKLFWAYLMELIGNMGQIEARFGPFGDFVNLDT